MNHCGQCKFWGNADETARNETFRQCQAVEHDRRDKTNEGGYNDESEKAEYRAAHKAVVLDGSGYMASLMTREDFACVLFEPTTKSQSDRPTDVDS